MLEQIADTVANSVKIVGNSCVAEQPRRAPVQLDGQFRELDLDFDTKTGVFWCRFQFSNRPSFTPEVLAELRRMRQLLASRHGAAASQDPQVKYMVLASRMPGIFNLGGDLHLFANLIRKRDRAALTAYARACVAEVHANSMALDLPIITVSLVQATRWAAVSRRRCRATSSSRSAAPSSACLRSCSTCSRHGRL